MKIGIDFDNNVAFINLFTLEELFNLGQENRNLEIYLNNPQNIEYQKIATILALVSNIGSSQISLVTEVE